MEAIKISVEVSVNLSENTQNFIKSLFSNTVSINELASAIPTKPVSQTASVPAPQPTPVSKPQAAAPAQTKPAATPVPGAPAAQAASSVSKSIEDVRAMLAKKVNEHRDVIKQKLNELGAPSVTKLDPSKYDEMYNFLESL
nr:MAG TPA: protein of unknown function (DUF3597) [Caudoviricetes sp.]